MLKKTIDQNQSLCNKYPPLVIQVLFNKWMFALRALGLVGVNFSPCKTLLQVVMYSSFLPPVMLSVLFNKRESKAFC